MISNVNDNLNSDSKENEDSPLVHPMILYCELCKKLVTSVISYEISGEREENFDISLMSQYLYPAIPCMYYLQMMRKNDAKDVVHRCPECNGNLECFLKR
uniref:LITAF domain-containing protein n=1 Tax=Parastrongyloides trichosuri TaxID=131310 RepID=A0A0N4ZGK1_PARTI